MSPDLPLVRVVVLNFDGGDMTLECLDSLLATDWPSDRLEIVMVDNASLDDVVERVATDERYRSVRVLEPLANLGFAGGCNLGIGVTGDHDYVALLNNDATIAPDWLRAMVPVAESDDAIGAVAAKMLFASRFHGIEFDVPDASHIVQGEQRLLGVRVSGVRIDGERADDRLAFDEGFHGVEPPQLRDGEEIARWSSASAALRVAADGSEPTTISVRLSCLEPRAFTLRSAIDTVTGTVGTEAQWFDIRIPAAPFDVINNVGSNLFAGGFAGDRGFLEVDEGQYDEPAEVFAWCGGAVLLKRSYLDDVGTFDERFFVYYEDTDLSWRGRLRGWRYVYEPGALVRHHHAQSSGVGSEVVPVPHRTKPAAAVGEERTCGAGLEIRARRGPTRRHRHDPALRAPTADAEAPCPCRGRTSVEGVRFVSASAPDHVARSLDDTTVGVAPKRSWSGRS